MNTQTMVSTKSREVEKSIVLLIGYYISALELHNSQAIHNVVKKWNWT